MLYSEIDLRMSTLDHNSKNYHRNYRLDRNYMAKYLENIVNFYILKKLLYYYNENLDRDKEYSLFLSYLRMRNQHL